MSEPRDDWRSGNVASFESLFRQYQGLVYKNAYLVTGSKEEAEDILQEVFMTVWRARETFDPEKGSLATWLHRITINKCLEKRRKKSLASVPLEEAPLAALVAEDPPADPADYDRLNDALQSLDAKHRVVLVLRYFNELSYGEIAYIINIPLGTVKSRINQALKLLRGRIAMFSGEW